MSNGFYRNLAQKISENLLHHVDGKPTSSKPSSSGKVNSSGHCTAKNWSAKGANKATYKKSNINLAAYNFPSHFNLNETIDEEHDESEVAMMNFLLAGELKKFQSIITKASPASSTRLSSIHSDDNYQPNNTIAKETHNNNSLIKSNLYICNVCGRGFDSLTAFDLHEINNHPNIICNYFEMTMEHNVAISLLNWINNSPMGLLKSCKVPDIDNCRSDDNNSPHIRCTKCGEKFSNSSSLHQHIISCASINTKVLVADEPEPNEPTSKPITRATKRNTIEVKSASFSRRKKKSKKVISKANNIRADKALKSNNLIKFNNRESSSLALKAHKNITAPIKSSQDEVKSLLKPKFGLRSKRRCPACSRVFKYLGNLKRHVSAGCNSQLSTSQTQQSADNSIAKRKKSRRGLVSSPASISDIECENSQNSKNVQPVFTPKETKTANVEEQITPKSDQENAKNDQDSHKLDLWKVKQEYPLYAFKGSPAQHHSCPFCRRGFTYLANYRRHIKEDCPIKRQENLKKQIKDSFEKCLLKTREALRKNWAQKISIPQSDQENCKEDKLLTSE